MSVPNSEINPPDEGSEESVHAICAECPKEYHVDDLVNGICPDCRPCDECDGDGCDECIEEVPKLPRASIEIAMDKVALILHRHPKATRHLIRETIAAHMDPEIKLLNGAIVGLIVATTNAVAQYAIATKDSLGQDEISQLKDTVVGMAANQTFLLSKFLSGLELEAELKKQKVIGKEIVDAFTEYSIAGCIDEEHSVAAYPKLRDAILKLPEVE